MKLPMRSVVSIFSVAAAVGVSVAAPSAAGADVPDVQSCGANAYVESIDVVPKSGTESNFSIVVSPTEKARTNGLLQDRNTTVSMWHQIQSCVPGLYGDLADSIWQQLECHQHFAVENFTGSTYDLETWRYPLSDANYATYIDSRCLNRESLFGPENGDPTVLIPATDYASGGGGGGGGSNGW